MQLASILVITLDVDVKMEIGWWLVTNMCQPDFEIIDYMLCMSYCKRVSAISISIISIRMSRPNSFQHSLHSSMGMPSGPSALFVDKSLTAYSIFWREIGAVSQSF